MVADAVGALATGPLAGLLAHGREALADDLDAPTLVAGPALRPFVLALLAERAAPLLVVTARSTDADALVDGLSAFLGSDRVELFPPWETLPHERLSPQPATVGRRLAILDRLVHPEAHEQPLLAVVAPARAALQPMDPRLGQRRPLVISAGFDGGFDGLIETLAGLGYARNVQVEARGDFAVRGGIVDLFPSAGAHAVRVEFWGDEVESLREFSVADQRSTAPVQQVVVDPARELVLDAETRDRARELARAMPSLSDQLQQLADGLVFEGVESLVTLLNRRPAYLTDFVPKTSGLVVVDPLLVTDRAKRLQDEAEALLEVSWESAAGHRPEDVGYADLDVLRERAPGRSWELTPFGDRPLPGHPWDSFRGDVAAFARRSRELLGGGVRVAVSARGHGGATRLAEVLRDAEVAATVLDEVDERSQSRRVEVVASVLREGFIAAELGLALAGDVDVFGPRRASRAPRRIGNRASAAEAVLDLHEGDFVVHRTHGVGRYAGMVTRQTRTPTGAPASRDYVVLDYAKGDRLYVPADQVDAVSRYVGGEVPSVMRLGGAEWERAKSRVRSAVREVAADLIRLYSARMHAPGIAFSADGAWQRELEDEFEHPETPDQLTVIDEIKRDMEAPLPMDRVLCGDVGFGKTEVAVRAAAKAIFDGKQAAVLVPTTLLAQQHFETFKDRFAGFPVDVRVMSRFVSAQERRRILDGLAAGTVDLVIGTHGLLGKGVSFKDLGLVVVDEEQRFGVTAKERLKQLRTSVDVLTMTATPIPRTLEMAVAGIRDLSVIETPPEDRQPVHTVVGPFDEAQVALAIRRELLRDGQVFYVHNQIESIDGAAMHLRELVPDAKVQIAHGQMDEASLERAMVRFWEREVDVLCCTTIIGSGLDVPNANTLIVERADLLGLADLHQLRGRVGRSTERGYAYFFFPANARLTEGAYERLQTIAEHTSLGSGLAIALRDLEIRGAGSLLGAEQHGHVAAVGFDTYTRLLKEEVADLTGAPVAEETEITVEVPVDANLPKDYVEDERLRLDLYRKIAAIRDAGGVKAVRDELVDRFGPMPPQAESLITLAALKAALRKWGIAEVTVSGGRTLKARPVHLTDSQQVRLQRTLRHAKWNPETELLEVPLPTPSPPDLVAWVAATLRDLFRRS